MSDQKNDPDIAITFVPSDVGSIIPGKSKAPRAFIDAGIIERLRGANIGVSYHDALAAPARYTITPAPSKGEIRNQKANLEVLHQVDSCIKDALAHCTGLSSPPFQLIIGGECCMLPGVLTALGSYVAAHEQAWLAGTRAEAIKTQGTSKLCVGLIYIDADLDMFSPTEPDTTGVFAGMTMTHLLGLPGALPQVMETYARPATTPSGALRPLLDAENTVFFGTNMNAPGNRRQDLAYLMEHGFTIIPATAVAATPGVAAKRALEHMRVNGVDRVLLHLDVDSIDPLGFPLANVPNRTGTTFEVMMSALKVLVCSDLVIGLVIAEVNPDHDADGSMVRRLTESLVDMLSAKFQK